MLYQRRMRLPHVEDPTLNGVPLERMMLSLSSDGITIDNAEPTVSMQDMPGRDGRLDLTLTDPSGAAYMGNRAITLSLYAIGGEDDILAAKTRLAALAGTVVTLSWRGLPGEYQGRMSLSAWEDKWAGPRQIATLVTVSIDAAPYLIGRTRTITLKTGANAIHIRGNRPCWPAWALAPRQRNQDRQHAGRARPQAHSRIRHRDHRTHHDRHLAGRARAARQRQPHDPHARFRLLPAPAGSQHDHPVRRHGRQPRVPAAHPHLGDAFCVT